MMTAMTLPEEGERRDTVITNTRQEQMSEPRVLFFAGDDILANEKHFNPDFKGFGGIYLPHVKTLRQSATKGMLYRCMFTRIVPVMMGEPVNMLHPQDRQNWETSFTQEKWNPEKQDVETVTIKGFKNLQMTHEPNPHDRTVDRAVNSNHIVFKKRYPEEDVALATRVEQPNGTRGVVEIVALRNASLAEVKDAQLFFFPKWKQYQTGEATMPETIRELENHIHARLNAIPPDWDVTKKNKYRMIAQDMLKSCTEYRLGGESYLHEVEMESNNAKARGFSLPYPEKAVIFGSQLEIKRKDDLIAGDSSAVDRLAKSMETRDARDIELRERELAIRERELALKEAEMKGATMSVEARVPVTEINVVENQTVPPYVNDVVATTGEGVVTPTAVIHYCGSIKANGEPCARTVDNEGDKCFQHA